MGVDSKRGGNESGDDVVDEAASTTPPRRPSSPIARPKTASVESSLDAFIARAKDKPLDVTDFDTGRREKILRDELDDLKAKLAEAEARPRRSWGLTVGAFLVGGAIMFAVSFVIPRSDKVPAPAPPGEVVSPAPTVTPIEPPVVEAARVQAAPPEPTALPEPTPQPIAPAPPEQTAPKAPVDTRAAKRTAIKRAADTVTPPPKPLPEKQGSDEGLFDPFR
jgi:hypothetical protein